MPLQVYPGDVLMFSNGGSKAVLIGQKLLSVGRDLNANYVHAGVVTGGGNMSSFAGVGSVEVAHAILTGITRGPLFVRKGFAEWTRAEIWRAPGRIAIAAQAAAQVAAKWSQSNGAKMAFSTRKALMSAFGSSSFGSEAQRRFQEYQAHRDTPGGPPSLNDTSVNKSMFCSMFVVAVFQAVLGSSVTAEMNADARYVSPMKLHNILSQKGWSYMGVAFDEGGGFKVAGANGNMVDV